MSNFKFNLAKSYKANDGNTYGPFKTHPELRNLFASCCRTGYHFDTCGHAPATTIQLLIGDDKKYKLSDFAIDSLTGMSKLAEVLEAWKDDLPEGFLKEVDECFKPVE